jgi:hypothetical protein
MPSERSMRQCAVVASRGLMQRTSLRPGLAALPVVHLRSLRALAARGPFPRGSHSLASHSTHTPAAPARRSPAASHSLLARDPAPPPRDPQVSRAGGAGGALPAAPSHALHRLHSRPSLLRVTNSPSLPSHFCRRTGLVAQAALSLLRDERYEEALSLLAPCGSGAPAALLLLRADALLCGAMRGRSGADNGRGRENYCTTYYLLLYYYTTIATAVHTTAPPSAPTLTTPLAERLRHRAKPHCNTTVQRTQSQSRAATATAARARASSRTPAPPPAPPLAMAPPAPPLATGRARRRCPAAAHRPLRPLLHYFTTSLPTALLLYY